MKALKLFLIAFLVLQSIAAYSQKYMVNFPVSQQDARVHVTLMYQEKNNAFGAMTQDYRITVKNNTADKLKVYIDYGAQLVCGVEKSHKLGPLGEGVTIGPSLTVGKPYDTDGIGSAVRLTESSCPKDSWKDMGKNENGSQLYSMLSTMFYRIVKIENLSEIQRADAEEKRKKEENAKKLAAEDEAKNATANNKTKDVAKKDDFWSDSGKGEDQNAVGGGDGNSDMDDDIVSSSNFQGNLSNIKEGEFFQNDKGEYFQKVTNGAKQVDKYDYDRMKAAEITAGFEQREAERKQLEVATTHAITTTFNSYYNMRVAGQNLKDASQLEGQFNTIEDLNRAFAAQMSEVSRMANEFKASKIQSAQAMATANSSTNSNYSAYNEALGAFAGIVGSIAADKAEKEAREELRAQRDAQERAIKARELQALTKIRNEVGKIYPEGGMPSSSHKITDPVLYLFAYSSNKNDWNKDITVPIKISNVIPVYRYADGTYPYLSNVKRTFEKGGIASPIIVGYFTNMDMAAKYQQSLIGVADQARFSVQLVDIKVKERNAGTESESTDFWGNESKKEKSDNETPAAKQKENDFWNN